MNIFLQQTFQYLKLEMKYKESEKFMDSLEAHPEFLEEIGPEFYDFYNFDFEKLTEERARNMSLFCLLHGYDDAQVHNGLGPFSESSPLQFITKQGLLELADLEDAQKEYDQKLGKDPLFKKVTTFYQIKHWIRDQHDPQTVTNEKIYALLNDQKDNQAYFFDVISDKLLREKIAAKKNPLYNVFSGANQDAIDIFYQIMDLNPDRLALFKEACEEQDLKQDLSKMDPNYSLKDFSDHKDEIAAFSGSTQPRQTSELFFPKLR